MSLSFKKSPVNFEFIINKIKNFVFRTYKYRLCKEPNRILKLQKKNETTIPTLNHRSFKFIQPHEFH